MHRRSHAVVLIALTLMLGPGNQAWGYIEAAYTLGRLIKESTLVVVQKVEKVDRERNLILLSKVKELKGSTSETTFRQNIGTNGFHPREHINIMEGIEVGKIIVTFSNKTASETYMGNYWYQCYNRGEWWVLNHAEPYLLRSYAGRMEDLVTAIEKMIKGEEVVVTCMSDGDKNALQLRCARLVKLKASMSLIEYDQQRDFVEWGAEIFRPVTTMAGFTHEGNLGDMGPGARGVAPADYDGDGILDLCLYGEEKVVLLDNAGNSAEPIAFPYQGGARAAAWADYNRDGRPDLLLATPLGLKLLSNTGAGFVDVSDRLPREAYYNVTAAAFVDYDGDGLDDILFANGFLGLRLYRNRGVPANGGAPTPLFEDVSQRVGLGVAGAASRVKGDHFAIADVNADGRPDVLYSAGTGTLLLNTPAGFVESRDSGISYAAGRVTPVFGDVTGNGSPDLVVPQAEGCRVFRNNGAGKFTDVTADSGDLYAFKGRSACAVLADFDGKGKLDLVVGCVGGPNQYFINAGDGRFASAADAVGLDKRIFNTRGLAAIDINNDKTTDLVMNNVGEPAAVLIGNPERK